MDFWKEQTFMHFEGLKSNGGDIPVYEHEPPFLIDISVNPPKEP
jgi:hypothetical protein